MSQMIVYVNSKNEIKDVNTTANENLVAVEVPDDVFAGWSVAKICCHKLILNEGNYAGFTPYVDSRIIEHIDNLGKANEQNSSDVVDTQMALAEAYDQTIENTEEIIDTQVALTEAYDQTVHNTDDITDVQLALAEMYEMLDTLATSL